MERTLAIKLAPLAVILLAVGACAPAAAPTAAPAAPAPAGAGIVVPFHAPGAEHPAKPKNMAAFVELDMLEFSFNDAKGQKNPVFRLPAGKVVGLHIHNEGKVLHELLIGRGAVTYEEVEGKKLPAGLEKTLFEEVETDLFFYYGTDKVEVEEARFVEIEVPVGVRDMWIRFTVPPELKGDWEIACFVKDHYEAGMKAKLVIE